MIDRAPAPAGSEPWPDDCRPDSSGIVDPDQFASELEVEIARRRRNGPNVAVAAISIPEIPGLTHRYGPDLVFDLISELVAVLQQQLAPNYVFSVAENGDIAILGRGVPVADTFADVERLCRGIASRIWDASGEAVRFTPTAGSATLDDGASAPDILRRAIDSRKVVSEPVDLWDERWETASDEFGTAGSIAADRRCGEVVPSREGFEPRRLRGAMAAELAADRLAGGRRRSVRGSDVWSRGVEASAPEGDRAGENGGAPGRRQPESARLADAMVLPPIGSAVGVPLLSARPAARLSGERPERSVAVEPGQPADDWYHTHTGAALDAIRASLASHATAALDAIEASLSVSRTDDDDPTPGATDLPVRRSTGAPVAPSSFGLPAEEATEPTGAASGADPDGAELPARGAGDSGLPVRSRAVPDSGLPVRSRGGSRSGVPVRARGVGGSAISSDGGGLTASTDEPKHEGGPPLETRRPPAPR